MERECERKGGVIMKREPRGEEMREEEEKGEREKKKERRNK